MRYKEIVENMMVPDGSIVPVIEKNQEDMSKDWNSAIKNAVSHFHNQLERKVDQLNTADPQQPMEQHKAVADIIQCIKYSVPLEDQDVLLDFSHPVGQRFLRQCRRAAISLHLDLKLMDHALDQAAA